MAELAAAGFPAGEVAGVEVPGELELVVPAVLPHAPKNTAANAAMMGAKACRLDIRTRQTLCRNGDPFSQAR